MSKSEIVPIDPEKSGNTRQISPSKRWVFTFNNYTENDYNGFVKLLKIHSSKFIIGKECGDQTHTKHLQGFIYFNKKVRPKSIFSIFPKIHWEKAKGSDEDNYFYCSKEGDFIVEGDFKIKQKVKTLDIKEFKPFQKSILDIYNGKINENKIIWIHDKKGQCGKTEFLRYMNITYNVPFAYGGKCSDIINLAFNNKDYLETATKPCFIYNFGRDIESHQISYSSMEQISDGCIANTKFEAGCMVFNKPHVIVFANCLPETKKLTSSRWIIYDIVNDELIKHKNGNFSDYFD
jgi:hypothetical protein